MWYCKLPRRNPVTRKCYMILPSPCPPPSLFSGWTSGPCWRAAAPGSVCTLQQTLPACGEHLRHSAGPLRTFHCSAHRCGWLNQLNTADPHECASTTSHFHLFGRVDDSHCDHNDSGELQQAGKIRFNLQITYQRIWNRHGDFIILPN